MSHNWRSLAPGRSALFGIPPVFEARDFLDRLAVGHRYQILDSALKHRDQAAKHGGRYMAGLAIDDAYQLGNRKYFHKMIDSREMTRHTPQPFDMNTNLITSIATRRNPAIAGIPFCPAMAIGQSLPRPEEMIEFDLRSTFYGTHFGHPVLGYSWNLGTRNIREGRQMA